MIKEKERGTVEQLLMTPASAIGVVTAKIAPLIVLVMGTDGAGADRGAPGLRGNLGAVGYPGPAHAVFVNPPLMALSGGFTPIEAVPKWIRLFTDLNPIAHFAGLTRGVLVRGSGLEVVHVQLFALGVVASVLIGFSAWKFRGQMS